MCIVYLLIRIMSVNHNSSAAAQIQSEHNHDFVDDDANGEPMKACNGTVISNCE